MILAWNSLPTWFKVILAPFVAIGAIVVTLQAVSVIYWALVSIKIIMVSLVHGFSRLFGASRIFKLEEITQERGTSV